ncbi:unnamed protein product [Closterium sp. NIES-64]|nr:unnamed protein product [Closterium sp. NIES-64]
MASQPCNTVARTGDPASCPFGATCRFSHDLDIIRAQLPPTLDGTCPFAALRRPCPFGLACRFRDEKHGKLPGSGDGGGEGGEGVNMLEKGLQSKLWKRQLDFPRAVDSLQRIGWTRKLKPKGEASLMPDLDENEQEGDQGVAGNRPSPTHFLHFPSLSPILFPSHLAFPVWQRKTVGKAAVAAAEAIGKDTGASVKEEGRVGDDKEVKLPHREKKPVDFKGKLIVAPLTTVGNLPFRRVCCSFGADVTVGEMAMCGNLLQGQASDMGAAAAARELDAGASDWALLRRHESEKCFGVQLCGPHPDMVAKAAQLVAEHCQVDFVDLNIGCPIDIVVNKPQSLRASHPWKQCLLPATPLLARKLTFESTQKLSVTGYSTPCSQAITLLLPYQSLGVISAAQAAAGSGSSLLRKPQRLEQVIRATALAIDVPLTVKMRMARDANWMRTGYAEGHNVVHRYIPHLLDWGATAVTLHGRTRQQRYSRLADWEYIGECASVKPAGLQFIGNGDVMAYTDWNEHTANGSATSVDSCMLARGALIKPWLLTEITEQRHWDISAGERLDMLRSFTRYGLLHWGSDTRGVETTRRFLLEWLSYLHRYVPVGLLELLPQRINWRPPGFYGRNDLETLFGSDQPQDWL